MYAKNLKWTAMCIRVSLNNTNEEKKKGILS